MESENNKIDVPSRYSVDSTDSSGGSPVIQRNKNRLSNLWRSRSLRHSKKNSVSILEAIPSVENLDTQSNGTVSTDVSYAVEKLKKKDIKDTIVTIVLVEAKGLPSPPDDGTTHGLFCKMRLGSRTFKSKMATNIKLPEWKEKFEIRLSKDHLLRMSLWDKGRQKNFMGSCVLDLSGLSKDRTHEIWQQLDDGYGSVHLSITMCNIHNNVITSYSSVEESDHVKEKKYTLRNLGSDWNIIGQLHVKVMCAKGLPGKPNAYCTLEVDNQRVQTHSARTSGDPSWEKSYVFDIYDISSTLDLKVYDSSLNQIRNESLGRVSIPLLRISNRTLQWYALKDRTKRHSAKGNCPRVLLDMSIFWNPVKATVRLFQPKEVKYLKKPPKFDLGLVHSNMEFIRDTFQVLYDTNENFKRLFEWDNQELSFVALLGWLFFWYNITLWGMPLVCLLPFLYHWAYRRNQTEKSFRHVYKPVDDKTDISDVEKDDNKAITLGKIQGLPEMTLKITSGVEYMVSLAERMYNLVTFKVPFLSYLAMLFLLISSMALYCIPFNYMMMAFGIYKFTRKYLDPGRKLNNDLLDFISRIPDNDILRDWKELSVPEPMQNQNSKTKMPVFRSFSAS